MTDLAYVRAQLRPLDRQAKIVVVEALKKSVSLKTLYRLASGRSVGRGDTIGRLATYFRRQKRHGK